MGVVNQFILLLWKNYLIQKRKKILTLLEIGIPTIFSLILIFVRLRVSGTEFPDGKAWSRCGFNYFGQLPKNLVYAPMNNVSNRIMQEVNIPEFQIVKGFETEQDMVDFLLFVNTTVNNTRDYLGGIVFTNEFPENKGETPKKISYKIRLSSSPRANSGKQRINFLKSDTSWSTQFMFPLFQQVGPREKGDPCGGNPGYVREGFMAIQDGVNKAIFSVQGEATNTSVNVQEIDLGLNRHPYPPYNDDNFVLVIQQQFPLIIMLSFVLVALNIVKDVVHEKERKLKETMKMMGLSSWLHWMAWFFKYFLFLLITVTLITVFCIIDTSKGRVVGQMNAFILFLFLMVYSAATISFCFMISVFFKKANSGAAAGGILFFCSYIPYFFLQPRYATLTWWDKIACCLVSNLAMAYGGQLIGMFEGTGNGIQWDTINQGVSVDDSFAMSHVFIMLALDTVLYGLVTWYIEALFPGEYGVPQRWYFFLTNSYWCGTSAVEVVANDKRLCVGQHPTFFESEPRDVHAGIQIRNLRKEFKLEGNHKVAVAGMSLDMYEGQITALLGHNGAGKTTTMSMLTGFIPPSSGTAFVNGHDIRTDISSVRSSLGLCPQHDVLFDTMTVKEHLTFFAKLKGMKSTKKEVEDMIQQLRLEDKTDAQSKTLSGGMKRKLSVGIALIGNSKIVILDEPSSGLDPNARRHIWSVLQKNRAGRTMVLTTHFMDEADLLGDRIAIMAEGVVKCCGSSLFLKNKYGAGYHMTIVKGSNCNVTHVSNVIKKYVPEAKIDSNVGAELSFVLPKERSSVFDELLTEIEGNQDDLGIASFGLSETTMEEVFLKVGEGSDSETRERILPSSGTEKEGIYLNLENSINFESLPDLSELDVARNTGWTLVMQQFMAMFIKRFLNTMRNKIVTLSQLIVPLFFTLMALIVIKTFPGPQDSPALDLIPEKFGHSFVVYSQSANIPNDSLFESFYVDQFTRSKQTVEIVNRYKEFRTNSNITKYLMDVGSENLGLYNLYYMIAADVAEESKNLKALAYFNDQSFHSIAISFASLCNAVVRYITNSSEYSISTTNHPLPRTSSDVIRDQVTQGATGFTLAFNVVFGMSFLASSFVVFIITERSSKSKHIQFVSGVHLFNFWSSTFCWDIINYLIPSLCIMISFACFGIEPFMDYHAGHMILLFFLFGWAILPFMYLASFIFSVPSSGYVWLTMFNILAGVATLLAVNILAIPLLGLADLAHALEWVFLVILPHYGLAQGMMDYYSNHEYNQICPELEKICIFLENPCCTYTTKKCGPFGCVYFVDNYLTWQPGGIGRMLVFLFLQGIVYFSILFFLESGVFTKILYGLRSLVSRESQGEPQAPAVESFVSAEETTPLLQANGVTRVPPMYSRSGSIVQEDSDVAMERSHLNGAEFEDILSENTVVVKNLTKYYGSHLAVDHLCLRVPKGECFGLLGINGAGKTTTFKTLTGDEMMTSGEAYIRGFSIRNNISEVRQMVGYCPQYDALIDQLTGRETLYMFGRLRGVPQKVLPSCVDSLIDALLLGPHADKIVKAYSGGNKRKLSTAIALIGNPSVILLDEPTTGMDPVARRFLWDTLSRVRDLGRTLILTSHSMEECEALCTRLAIMVNGQFKCLGSTQHLKNKFGEGFTLLARLPYPEEGGLPDTQPLMDFIVRTFPGSVLKDVHHGMLHYQIKNTSVSWAYLFEQMEKAKEMFSIDDYSVSQTTLEQVFINFARSQNPPLEHKRGCCHLCTFFCCPCL